MGYDAFGLILMVVVLVDDAVAHTRSLRPSQRSHFTLSEQSIENPFGYRNSGTKISEAPVAGTGVKESVNTFEP